MPYRNKTYVCFDADTDMWAYKYMVGWKNNDNIDFDFYNAHDLNNLREGSSESTIKAKLRERMKNSKLFLALIGEKTKNLFRFVRWEMEIAIELEIPIVVVYLNKSKSMDSSVCPLILRDILALHIPYKQSIIKWAIDNWPTINAGYKTKNDKKPKIITAEKYKKLEE